MTTFNNYSQYLQAQAQGQKSIRFVSLNQEVVAPTNGISPHLKHTIAAIQGCELMGAA